MHGRSRNTAGFSLIEMIMVLAMIAILAVVALPSYQTSIRKARRVEGREYLHGLMMAQERYHANFNRYAADLGSLGQPDASQPGGYYALSEIDVSAGAQFVRIAVAPQNAQAADSCGEMTLDSAGRSGASGGSSDECG